jgi:hypothetical protein
MWLSLVYADKWEPTTHIPNAFRILFRKVTQNNEESKRCRTWVSHSGGYEELCFHAVYLTRLIFRPWKWRWYVSPKRRLTFNGLHGVTSQKIVFFIRNVEHKSQEVCLINIVSDKQKPHPMQQYTKFHKWVMDRNLNLSTIINGG